MLRHTIMQLLQSRLWRVSCHARRHRRSAKYPLMASEQLEDRTLLSAVLPDLSSALDTETESFPEAFSDETIARLQDLGVQVSSNTDSESFVTLWPSDISAVSQGGIVPQTDESYGIINLDTFRNDPRFAGIDGTGYSVVVIDTGIDLNHPFFGPDNDSNGIADRIVFQYDFSRWNDPNASDFNGHGSNVASIVGSSDATYPGMAPGVNIIALKVFPDNSGSATNRDIEQALQWAVNNQAQYNIVSVNMSIGSGNVQNFTNVGFSDEYSALAAMGVVTAVASGNSFYSVGSVQGVNSLSADPNVLSVGAVYDQNIGGVSYSSGATANTTDADRITPFTQRHSTLLDIFAPGAGITGANQSGGIVTYHGTSQATPHIAGITALIQQLSNQYLGRMLTFNEVRDVIRSTATTINDGDDENDNVVNTNLDFLRVDMLAIGEAILAAAGITNPDQIGVSRESQFFYLDTTENGAWDKVSGGDMIYDFGQRVLRNVATPIVGDWDGDGNDEMGLYNNGYFYLDTTGNGSWDRVSGGDTIRFLNIGGDLSVPVPIIGDWDGNGTDDVGLYNNGLFYLDTTGNGVWDRVSGGDTIRFFNIGGNLSIPKPVVGDWDGDGDDDIGLYNNGLFYLDTTGNGAWDRVAGGDTINFLNIGGDMSAPVPIVGDWNGDSIDDLGLFNNSYFYLDTTANGSWDRVSGGDTIYEFLVGGDRSLNMPIIGKWSTSSSTSSETGESGSLSVDVDVAEIGERSARFVVDLLTPFGSGEVAESVTRRYQMIDNSVGTYVSMTERNWETLPVNRLPYEFQLPGADLKRLLDEAHENAFSRVQSTWWALLYGIPAYMSSSVELPAKLTDFDVLTKSLEDIVESITAKLQPVDSDADDVETVAEDESSPSATEEAEVLPNRPNVAERAEIWSNLEEFAPSATGRDAAIAHATEQLISARENSASDS